MKIVTPDKVGMKILSEFARAPVDVGLNYSFDVIPKLFPGCGPNQNKDLFNGLVIDKLLAYGYKQSRRDYYVITDKGMKFYNYAMQFKKITEFISLGMKFNTLEEFILDSTLQGKAELADQKFFESDIKPFLENDVNLVISDLPGVDNAKIITHIRNKILKIPFIKNLAMSFGYFKIK